MKLGILKLSVLLAGLFILPRMARADFGEPKCTSLKVAPFGELQVQWQAPGGIYMATHELTGYVIWEEYPQSSGVGWVWTGAQPYVTSALINGGVPGTYYVNVSATFSNGDVSIASWCPYVTVDPIPGCSQSGQNCGQGFGACCGSMECAAYPGQNFGICQ